MQHSEDLSSEAESLSDEEELDSFSAYINDLLDGPKVPWPKAEKAVDVLFRRKAIVSALNELKAKGWAKSAGGFKIPRSTSS